MKPIFYDHELEYSILGLNQIKSWNTIETWEHNNLNNWNKEVKNEIKYMVKLLIKQNYKIEEIINEIANLKRFDIPIKIINEYILKLINKKNKKEYFDENPLSDEE